MEVGFDALYGLEVTEWEDGAVSGRTTVRPELLQPAGIVHGGVLTAMAEALTSMATHMAVAEDGRAAMGMSNHTSFVRPIAGGSVNAIARARHRGRTTWVWEVELADDEGRLCALSRVTVAVREASQPR
jgi:uncharacterized protein (TIGR00369 family)